LAGVAEFDRKIVKAKETLETVKEKEERCEILQQELIKTRDRALLPFTKQRSLSVK